MNPLADKSHQALLVLVQEQTQTIAFLLQKSEALEQEIARLKGLQPGTAEAGGDKLKTPPSPFVKPNKPAPPAKTRKQRKGAVVRKRKTPTQQIVNACSPCPDGGRALAGGAEYSHRQILDLPPMMVQIADHVVHSRYGGVCRKSYTPTVDLSEQAAENSRFGQQIHSLVAYLRLVGHTPIRTIASVLSALSGVWRPEVPAENNAAERSIRPRVIGRKISGGTRPSARSLTMATLSSLFATWHVQRLECLSACRQMLQDGQRTPVRSPA